MISKRARALLLKKSGKYKKKNNRSGFLLNKFFKRFRLHIAVLLIILIAGFLILQQSAGLGILTKDPAPDFKKDIELSFSQKFSENPEKVAVNYGHG